METLKIKWFMYLTAEGLQITSISSNKDNLATTLEDIAAGKWLYIPPEKERLYNEYVCSYPYASYEEIFSLLPPSLEVRKQKVKEKRQQLYSSITDPLYISYQKYLAREEIEKAEIAKKEWLEALKKIEEENPYPDNN